MAGRHIRQARRKVTFVPRIPFASYAKRLFASAPTTCELALTELTSNDPWPNIDGGKIAEMVAIRYSMASVYQLANRVKAWLREPSCAPP